MHLLPVLGTIVALCVIWAATHRKGIPDSSEGADHEARSQPPHSHSSGSAPPFETTIIPVNIGNVPSLHAVQIQPAEVSFNVNDFASRRQVLNAVLPWVTGTLPEAIALGTVPGYDPSPRRPRSPSTPWLLCFPELFLPSSLLFDVARTPLGPGSVVMSGLCVLNSDGPAADSFDNRSLRTLKTSAESHRERISFPNLELLDQLIRATTGGGKANLAVTVAIDVERRPTVIFHAKLVPSKFEHSLDELVAPIGASSLYAIELRAHQAPNPRTLLLPLICSDFFKHHDQSAKSILQHWAEKGTGAVTFLCIMNVQPISTTRLQQAARWPVEVTDVLEQLTKNHLGPDFSRSQVLLTNVGAYTYAEGKRAVAGGTEYVFRQDLPRGGESLKKHWDWVSGFAGEHRIFANATYTGQEVASYRWFTLDGTAVPRAEGAMATALAVRDGVTNSLAVGQHLHCRLREATGTDVLDTATFFVVDGNAGVTRG